MDRLRFKCKDRGGPITLVGEIDEGGKTKSAKLLTFSPTAAGEIVFTIDAIDATILGKLHGPAPTEAKDANPTPHRWPGGRHDGNDDADIDGKDDG